MVMEVREREILLPPFWPFPPDPLHQHDYECKEHGLGFLTWVVVTQVVYLFYSHPLHTSIHTYMYMHTHMFYNMDTLHSMSFFLGRESRIMVTRGWEGREMGGQMGVIVYWVEFQLGML